MPFIQKVFFTFFVGLLSYAGFLTTALAGIYTYPAPEEFYPGSIAVGYEVLQSMNGNWHTNERKIFPVPFCTDDYTTLTIAHELFFHEPPKDTLYMYFQGILGNSSIYLNGRLLQLTANLFREHFIAIPPDLFTGQWNHVQVKITKGEPVGAWLEKVPLIGIHRPAYLLRKSLKPYPHTLVSIPCILQADSTLVLATYASDMGFTMSKELLIGELSYLKQKGINKIYLPFPPTNELKEIITKNGFQQIIIPGVPVAFYNYYPLIESKPFWKNEVRYKTNYWGYYSSEDNNKPAPIPFFLFVITIPTLILTLLKLLDPWGFKHFVILISKLGFESESLSSNNYYRYGFYEVSLVLRVLLLSIFAFFFLKIFESSGNPLALQILYKLENHSFATPFQEILAQDRLQFLILFLWVSVFYLLRQFFWRVCGLLFGIKDMVFKVNLIELQAEFGLVLAFSLIGFVGLVIEPGSSILRYLLMALIVIHIIRKLIISNIGFVEAFKFSVMGNILYICVVDLMPWLVWLK